MKVVTRVCDICNAPTGREEPFLVGVGTEFDQCGDRRDIEEEVDLCDRHVLEAFVCVLHKDAPWFGHYNIEAGKRLMLYVKERI